MGIFRVGLSVLSKMREHSCSWVQVAFWIYSFQFLLCFPSHNLMYHSYSKQKSQHEINIFYAKTTHRPVTITIIIWIPQTCDLCLSFKYVWTVSQCLKQNKCGVCVCVCVCVCVFEPALPPQQRWQKANLILISHWLSGGPGTGL